MDEIYQQALKAAQEELERLSVEKPALEARLTFVADRIKSLEKIIITLNELVNPEEEKTGSLTGAIIEVLNSQPETGFTPTGIRDGLRKKDFPIQVYSNPLAVIHTTLKRLIDQGKVKTFDADGAKYYQYVTEEEIGIIPDKDIPFCSKAGGHPESWARKGLYIPRARRDSGDGVRFPWPPPI